MAEKQRTGVSVAVTVLTACLFYAISGGIRSNYGLIRGAISDSSGVDYAAVSFILAVAQLSFGVMQPVFGALALKISNAFVLGCGAVMTAAGLVALPLCHGKWTLMLCLGVVMPAGLGAFSFGVLMGAITPVLGEQRASSASGIVSASNGLGSIVFAPILQGALDRTGLWGAVLLLGLPTVCLLPAALRMSGRQTNARSAAKPQDSSLKAVLGSALRDRSYRLLMLGFFTCGFYMAIIETHLYSHFAFCGFSNVQIAYAFSVYGMTTMLGCVFSGFLGSRFPMERVLGCLYASRAVWIAGFLLLPKTLGSMYLFAALLGFTGSATVPPTSGLVSRMYGPERLGTLFGLVFVAHQLGSFFSAWLGGVCVTATGGYTVIWLAGGALSLLAGVVSFCVDSTPRCGVETAD